MNNEDKEVSYITEIWTNEDMDTFQAIQYRPYTKHIPEVNEKLNKLLRRTSYNKFGEVIAEE